MTTPAPPTNVPPRGGPGTLVFLAVVLSGPVVLLALQGDVPVTVAATRFLVALVISWLALSLLRAVLTPSPTAAGRAKAAGDPGAAASRPAQTGSLDAEPDPGGATAAGELPARRKADALPGEVVSEE